MIRFSCPTCHREYVLADALFGLPLVCKGCGQRLNVPPPQPDPPPVPYPPPAPPTKAPPTHAPGSPSESKPEILAPNGVARAKPDAVDAAFLSADTWANLDVPPEKTPTPPPAAVPHPPLPPLLPVPTPLPYEKPKPWVKVPPPAPVSAPPAGRKLIGIVVDVAVALVLLALGVIVGEFAAGKSTREVMATAAAPKFPPVDLLMWLAGPAFFLLVYVWLGTRGRTVGGWLRRRG